MESDLVLIAASLVGMTLVTDVIRRTVWLAFPRKRFSPANRALRRSLGYVEILLLAVALIALIQLVRVSGVDARNVKSIVGQWWSLLENRLPGNRASVDRASRYHSFPEGRVIKVLDGDSVVIRLVSGVTVEARLYGIDAPEYSQPHGSLSKNALGWKVMFRTVRFNEFDVDDYGRRVVVLYREGRNINAEMVCEGHAWWYRKYARSATELQACEATARDDGLGLWREDDPVRPWVWRRR